VCEILYTTRMFIKYLDIRYSSLFVGQNGEFNCEDNFIISKLA